jgi:hypothetical protein
MTEGSEKEPHTGRERDDEGARRSPAFGHEEAGTVADAQDEAVEQGLLPPSRDETGPDADQA